MSVLPLQQRESVIAPRTPLISRDSRARRTKLAAVALAALLVHCHLDQLFSGNASGQIVVAPAHVVESAPIGTASPIAESIEVTSSPAGVLLWIARTTRPANWLAIAETSGTAPGTFSLSLRATGLGIGTYRDTVLFMVDGAGAAPTVVPVELDVLASGVHLVVTTQPTATAAGVPIAPAVQVTAEDSLGNAVTSFASPITVAIGTNTGGGTLSGTATATPNGGAAAFPDLRINKADTGYTLHFTAGALSATSAPLPSTPPGLSNSSSPHSQRRRPRDRRSLRQSKSASKTRSGIW